MSFNRKTHLAEYNALKNAIHRCHNKDNLAYRNYGARGIKVSEELRGPHGLQKLVEAIGRRPTPGHSLDRIDNDGDYTLNPLNLRWADRSTQQNNRREQARTVTDFGWGIGLSMPRGAGRGHARRYSALVPYQGRTQTIADWAHELGIATATIRQRLERGLPPERALDTNTTRFGEKRHPKLVSTVTFKKVPRPSKTQQIVGEFLDEPNDPLKAEIDKCVAILNRVSETLGRTRH